MLSSALSPQTWPFSLEWLPSSACLVGGAVRDALLGRQAETLDLDFVLPEQAVQTAQAIARHYRAGFVVLDAERQIARLVFPQATADFALQEGVNLETDLKRRDFTVNAIAYSPHQDELIDPLQGHADLQEGIIRMVSSSNLREDPLRLLRAYRQAAQLGFRVEPETRVALKTLAPLLVHIAAERVQTELNYLLRTVGGAPWLRAAWQDGLLEHWLPHSTETGLDQVEKFEQFLAELGDRWPALAKTLNQEVSFSNAQSTKKELVPSHRTWLAIAKLTCLLAPDAETAEAELLRLKMSRAEVRAALLFQQFLPTLKAGLPTRRDRFFFFQAVGPAFAALAMLAIASGTPIAAIAPLLDHYFDSTDPVAHPQALLSGRDLMTTLKLPPGPQIGQLLTHVQVAQAEGLITTQADALAWIRAYLASPPSPWEAPIPQAEGLGSSKKLC